MANPDRPISVHEYKKLLEKRSRGGKYNNILLEVDDIKFDSIKEATFYGKCKMRIRPGGDLLNFKHHVIYPLVVNRELICNYEADFVLYYPDGKISVVDIKSEATENLPVFRLKKKLMFAIHKIKVVVIK